MTPAELDGLQPLRGPLGFSELFFTRRSSPLLAFIRPRRFWVWALIALGFVTWMAYLISLERDPRDVLLMGEFVVWLGLEAACFIYGLRLNWCASRRQRQRRVAELALTGMRPLEIGQWILARSLWPPMQFFLVVSAAICLIHMIAFSEYPYFLLGYAAIVANTLLTLYMMQWMQLTLSISAASWTQALRRQLMFLVVYLFAGAIFAVVYTSVFVMSGEIFRTVRGYEYMLCNLMIYPMLVPFWLMKYRFARAFAERLERAVFHRIEF